MGKILKKLIIILIMVIVFIAVLFFIFNHKNDQATKKIKEELKTTEKETSKEEIKTEDVDTKEETNTEESSNNDTIDSATNSQTSDNYSNNTQNSNSSNQSNNSNYNKNYNQVEDNYIPVTKYNAKIKNNRLYVGDTTTITTVITPSNATNQEITYTSSNPNVAIVSKTGVVTAINPGECSITISVKNVTNTGSLKVYVLSKNNTIYNNIENNRQ